MFCDNLDWWDRVGGGREIQGGGDVHIPMDDSHWYMAETNTILYCTILSLTIVLSLLYGPTLISIHDYWKNHSLDYTDLWWQSNVFAFNILSRFVIVFPPRKDSTTITVLISTNRLGKTFYYEESKELRKLWLREEI